MDGTPYGRLEAALDPEEHGRGMDMCSINPSYLGKPYRYAYACGARRPCNFPNTLTKVHNNEVYPNYCVFGIVTRIVRVCDLLDIS